MRFYVMVSFWLGFIAFVIRILELCIVDWPRTRKVSLGEQIAQTLVNMGFLFWAGILLWDKLP